MHTAYASKWIIFLDIPYINETILVAKIQFSFFDYFLIVCSDLHDNRVSLNYSMIWTKCLAIKVKVIYKTIRLCLPIAVAACLHPFHSHLILCRNQFIRISFVYFWIYAWIGRKMREKHTQQMSTTDLHRRMKRKYIHRFGNSYEFILGSSNLQPLDFDYLFIIKFLSFNETLDHNWIEVDCNKNQIFNRWIRIQAKNQENTFLRIECE